MKFNLKAFSKILRNQNAYKNGYLNGELDFDLVSPDENNALEERENGLYVEDLQPQIDEIKTKNTQQDNAIKANTDKNTAQDTEIETIKAKDQFQDNEITAIKTKNTQQDNAIKANTDKNTAQDTAISTVQNGLTTLQNTVATYKVKELAITDTATVDMVMSGTTTRNLSANVKKSTTANNAVTLNSTGVYVEDLNPKITTVANGLATLTDTVNNLSIPNDSNLVHKTGDEVINGKKTFNDVLVRHNNSTNNALEQFAMVQIQAGQTLPIIRNAGNLSSGIEALFGSNGLTVVSAGESGQQLHNAIINKNFPSGINPISNIGVEDAVIVADGYVKLQQGWQNTATVTEAIFKSDGFHIPSGNHYFVGTTPVVENVTVTDTNTIDLTVSGTNSKTISGNVKLDAKTTNAISIGPSGGLYVQDVRPDLQTAINDINTLKQKQAFDVLYQGDVTVKAPPITIPGKKMNTYRKLDFIIDLNWARNTQTFLQNELSNELTIYFINSKMPNAAGSLNFSITESNARAHFDTNTFEILNVKTITHSTSATGGFSRSDTNSGNLPIRIIGWY